MIPRRSRLLAAAAALLLLQLAVPACATNVQIDKAYNQVRLNDPNTNLPLDMSDCTPIGLPVAASTNATSVKASAGIWCGGVAINTTATIEYLRFYNLATVPTCSSATGFVFSIPIPASTSGAGTPLNFAGSWATKFTTGIAWCVTGGGASTDNSNAATGTFIAGSFK